MHVVAWVHAYVFGGSVSIVGFEEREGQEYVCVISISSHITVLLKDLVWKFGNKKS